MADAIQCEDEMLPQDLFDSTSAVCCQSLSMSLGALSMKQEESADDPSKDAEAKLATVSKAIGCRRGKSKGNVCATSSALLHSIKYFVGPHDASGVMIYCWITPTIALSHFYLVDPDSARLSFYTDATKELTIGSFTYDVDISSQTLELRGCGSVGLYLEFQQVLEFYRCYLRQFGIVAASIAPQANIEAPINSAPSSSSLASVNPGIDPAATSQAISSQQSVATSTNFVPPTSSSSSASGDSVQGSDVIQSFGISPSDLSSSPMIIRIPEGVNTSDRLHDYAGVFKKSYRKRGDKTLQVSCFHCQEIQEDLRPSTLARHLSKHSDLIKGKCSTSRLFGALPHLEADFPCNQCEHKCRTQQQLDRHKGSKHGGV
ncbi:hypothetical protein FRC12_005497 [Ceratobasidium sp. 428]|nr:hypothetical protein FRC12_005497 [Ceratobasidium sp. 428]